MDWRRLWTPWPFNAVSQDWHFAWLVWVPMKIACTHCHALHSARIGFWDTGALGKSGMLDFSAVLCSGFDVSIVLHSLSCGCETKIGGWGWKQERSGGPLPGIQAQRPRPRHARHDRSIGRDLVGWLGRFLKSCRVLRSPTRPTSSSQIHGLKLDYLLFSLYSVAASPQVRPCREDTNVIKTQGISMIAWGHELCLKLKC